MGAIAIGDRVANRIVEGLPTANRVLVRDRCGRSDLVASVVGAFDSRDAEAIVHHRSDGELRRLLSGTSASDWSYERLNAAGEFPDVDATVTLGGWGFDPIAVGLDPAVVAAWGAAVHEGIQGMDDRGMMTLAVAIPSLSAASALGTTVAELDSLVFPAILADTDRIGAQCRAAASAVEVSPTITLRSPGCQLDLDRGLRIVHLDDGVIDAGDQVSGAVVSNLPAGSVYWSVAEEATSGSVRLDDGTILTFDPAGRVASGEFRGERLSHVGIGLNHSLAEPVGWTIIDEHVAGRLFLALGENRYMGGENASAINVDFLVAASASIHVGASPVVNGGRLVI